MTDDQLFDELDLEGDGLLSRQELRQGSLHLGWGRAEAPLYALLDFLTVHRPLPRDGFIAALAQASGDPRGIYGPVLRRGGAAPAPSAAAGADGDLVEIARSGPWRERLAGTLQTLVGEWAAREMAETLDELALPQLRVPAGTTALLAIDPQAAFTAGDWMRALGAGGAAETAPVRLAFANCAALLAALHGRAETLFTRCPFSPDSYQWDERLAGLVAPDQHYFIKPGNSVLLPEDNGFREWAGGLAARGITTLVMGGCTLTSCVRVSAVETAARFRDAGLTVAVDLALCGARTGNYLSVPHFGNMSPVEAAIRQMTAAGVTVADSVAWFA